jgi:hypothetical protein
VGDDSIGDCELLHNGSVAGQQLPGESAKLRLP